MGGLVGKDNISKFAHFQVTFSTFLARAVLAFIGGCPQKYILLNIIHHIETALTSCLLLIVNNYQFFKVGCS
jgi:hypothetical protein